MHPKHTLVASSAPSTLLGSLCHFAGVSVVWQDVLPGGLPSGRAIAMRGLT